MVSTPSSNFSCPASCHCRPSQMVVMVQVAEFLQPTWETWTALDMVDVWGMKL